MARHVLDDGIEAGLEQLAELPTTIPGRSIERGINALGYQLLEQGRSTEAMQLLAFNTRAFPDVANTWDSLAEAYLQAGNVESAIKHYRKALELDPSSTTAVAALNRLGPPGSPKVAATPRDPLEDWPSEIIQFPPDFAPGLPSGIEALRFTPGWRDPSSDEFWSYVLAMWIDEPVPDAARVSELLDLYYDGLLSVFAKSAGRDIGDDPVQVEVTLISPGAFNAKMRVIDAFATFEPMELAVRISAVADTQDRTILRIQVSPQSDEHRIWQSLEAAVAGLDEPRRGH